MIYVIANTVSFLRFIFWKTLIGFLGGELGEGTRIYENVKIYSAPGASIKIGKNSALQKGVVLAASDGGKLTLGENVYLGEYVVISARGQIEIGAHTIIASHTFIVDFDHRFEDPKKTIGEQGFKISKVIIGKDVWIGAGCKILKGVEIGEGSVIGAGSVVTKNIPPFSVCAGVPASVIRKRALPETSRT
jgi:acetyltransferase-like isoleucine patch superfamily enzyme